MAIVYGITPTGFVIKPLQTILAAIGARQIATIDPAFDLSPDTPEGQLNGIISEVFAELWEIAQVTYNALDRDKAEGDALEALGKLTGTAKAKATFATCKLDLVFSQACTIQAGINFIESDLDATVRFTPVNDVIVTGAGTATNVVFRAENAGPVSAPTGHLTVIATPVSGWDSGTNTTDATGGLPADNDASLRAKMSNDVARTGASTVDAIRADVLDIASTDPAFTKILSCTVFENVTDVTDANGLPPHSFEALVYDGDVPGAPNDNLIAQAIWDSKPAGIRAFGSITGTAIDKQGNSQTVSFSRVTPIPIYLTYQLVTDGTYPGNTAFEAFIAGLANAAYAASPIGADVIASRASAAAFFVAGVLDVLSLKLGFSASPSGTSNLVIGARDLARFDSSRIVNV